MGKQWKAGRAVLCVLAIAGLLAVPLGALADPPIKVGKPIIKKDPPKPPPKAEAE